MIELYKGEAIEKINELANKGVRVDAVIADIPYGTTACSWDNVIP